MKAKYILIISILCLIMVFLLNLVLCKPDEYNQSTHEIKIDTIFIRDTVEIEKLIVKTERFIRVDTFFVDSGCKIEIPLTEKVYEDSSYYAVVSGYKPNLDTLRLYPEKEIITETLYFPKIEYKKYKWSVGIQIGYGTDFQKTFPYVGLGLQYNIFQW